MYELFAAHTWWAVFFALLLALLVGSFLNVVILRLPVMMEREWQAAIAAESAPNEAQDTFNLAVPRSRCNHCGHLIRWYENIPVFSWLVLRGKCSSCSSAISLATP
ncbi:prepilin peptidase [Nitrincola sp. A-D6]|uniref:prepilin peptidase n=1 Tax=Nitrincola sp. A-D6 TaxID=1545442 RepID=UPI000AA01DDE